MTVQQLAQALSLHTFLLPEPDRWVTGGYVGDLLSWVMGRAKEGDAWLTIMSNQNVAAVALMAEVACVVLTEGVVPDDSLLFRARQQGIDLLGTERSSFQATADLARLLAEGAAPED